MNHCKKNLKILILTLLVSTHTQAVQPDQKTLPIGFASFEHPLANRQVLRSSSPPDGPIYSLGEWEESEAVMTLWPNASLLQALTDNGSVKLFADDSSAQNWWANWLTDNQISQTSISYFIAPTDSMWIRDYGPWFIMHGEGEFAMIDNKYNRPRPLDDVIPQFLAKTLSIPIFQSGLIHTGGNYYSDGLGEAFSSTLVYSENSTLTATQIVQRMLDFLGIQNYLTSSLGGGITIEHIDTFAKLVSPDTWVVGDFPQDTSFYTDVENFIAQLKNLTSPYGTPYRIYRLKMFELYSGVYKAYINSFISNGVLYYPAYHEASDQVTEQVYAQALPGYKIIGVENDSTEWGDSVHCRNRNLLTANTIFVFPKVTKVSDEEVKIQAKIFPSPGAQITSAEVKWQVTGHNPQTSALQEQGDHNYNLNLGQLPKHSHLAFYLEAQDSSGHMKTAPIVNKMRIEMDL